MRLLSFAEVARTIGISEPTLRKIRGDLPGAVNCGARTRYKEDAIRQWIEAGGRAA